MDSVSRIQIKVSNIFQAVPEALGRYSITTVMRAIIMSAARLFV